MDGIDVDGCQIGHQRRRGGGRQHRRQCHVGVGQKAQVRAAFGGCGLQLGGDLVIQLHEGVGVAGAEKVFVVLQGGQRLVVCGIGGVDAVFHRQRYVFAGLVFGQNFLA